MPAIMIGISLANAGQGGGGLVPPPGFAFVIDDDGNFYVDDDGNRYITEI